MDTFRSLVQPLVGPSASSAGMIDGMKLVVLGGTVETARRMGSRAWSHFVNSFFLTAHFSEDDYPYDWLMLWLSRRPEWQRSREFETTTRLSTPLSGGSTSSGRTADNSFGDEDYREWWAESSGETLAPEYPEIYNYDDDDVPGKVKTRVVFQPTFDTTHTIYYRGHWLRVRRWRKGDNMNNNSGGWGGNYGYNSGGGGEMLSVSVVARSNTILKQLVLQAKREYEAEAIHRIQIYFADSHGGWRWTDSRHKRPMSSIVLNPGVKEMLLSDTKDFLRSEKWYADRGIPFRRGYLLHGVPGSGKSSLIHAIAGELMLDIYALSLSAAWINDATLTTLMGRVPARCIVLLEDLDAALTRSTARRSKKDKKKKDKKDKKDKKKEKEKADSSTNSGTSSSGLTASASSSRRRRAGASGINGGANTTDAMSEVNTLTLSGLLNALDGVAAAEGRLLFATTNHLDHLDPALSRPGRMDVWIDFKNASRWQAEALFRNFFPSCEEEEDSRAPTPTPTSPSSSTPSVSSRSPSQSARHSRASSAAPAEHSDGTTSLDQGTLPPLAPELSAEDEAEFAAMGLVLPDVPRNASDAVSAEGDIENLGAEGSSSGSRPSTASSGVGSWVAFPQMASTSMPPVKRVENPTRHTATSSGTWSPSPSLSSLTSAVWSMSPSFMSSTASLVGSAVGAVTGSTPPNAARSRATSSVSQPRAATPQRKSRPKTQHTHSSEPLSPSVLSKLAKEFAEGVPEEEFSVASLQGYLLKNKSRPEDAVKGVRAWVEEERRNREKQKGAKGKSEEERKKRRKEKKEKKEKKKRSKEESNVTQPLPSMDSTVIINVPASSTTTPAVTQQQATNAIIPTESMILTSAASAATPTAPLVIAPEIPVIPAQEVVSLGATSPEATTTKKSKSKSKSSKSRKSKSTRKTDEDSDSDSSSSSSSSDSESDSDSDSDSSSDTDSSTDDEDENLAPRPPPSSSTMMRSPPSPPMVMYEGNSGWSTAPPSTWDSWGTPVPPGSSSLW
ncbi:hypothetical protein GYMLUDRAFT_35668 [Collybiopsis luxurians FD-317 M1]|nr:hypothetical protein GYMLUDRAFT_35668 [Collybiopsis luxurians FD-317 M1]